MGARLAAATVLCAAALVLPGGAQGFVQVGGRSVRAAAWRVWARSPELMGCSASASLAGDVVGVRHGPRVRAARPGQQPDADQRHDSADGGCHHLPRAATAGALAGRPLPGPTGHIRTAEHSTVSVSAWRNNT